MTNVSRGMTRFGVVALLVLLAGGSGAAAALADSAKNKKHAPTASPASTTSRGAAAHPPATAARPAPASHAPRANASASPRVLTTSTTAPSRPTTTAIAGPFCANCLGSALPNANQIPIATQSTASVSGLALGGSVVLLAKPHTARRSALSLLEVAGPQPASALRSSLAAPRAAGPAARAALPTQGPSALGASLRLPASQADVPVFVAFVGLILVLLGARNVGRFRIVGDDEDANLTWPTA